MCPNFSQSKWELPAVEEREVSEKERSTLEILRQQRGTNVPADHRFVWPTSVRGAIESMEGFNPAFSRRLCARYKEAECDIVLPWPITAKSA